MSDRSRQRLREYNPHLGLGNRREESNYHPKFTHEDLDRIVDELLQRVSTNGADIGIIDLGEANLAVGYSKSYYPLRDATLSVIYGSLSAPGTTSTSVNVVVNGVVVASLTFPAGETFVSLDLSIDFNATDRWQMYVSTAGAGATGATFFGRFD